MSAGDLDGYRARLEEERARVVHAIGFLERSNPGTVEDETEEESLDLADAATATHDREVDYTLGENAQHLLRAIDDALARIEAGSYGACVDCGAPIAPERLDAVPQAARCIDCQRRVERP